MIAQDADEVFISVSSFNDAYLDYLFGPAPNAVLPQNTNGIPMLEIQEFGPFKIDKRNDLRLLAHIILALLITELKGLRAGTEIQEALAEMR